MVNISNWSALAVDAAKAGCVIASCHVDQEKGVITGPSRQEQAEQMVNGAMNLSGPIGMVTGPLEEAGQPVVRKGLEDAGEALGRAGLDLTEQSVRDKLARYLLNESHPTGGPKAEWFKQALGFAHENLEGLAQQIKFDPATAIQTGVTEYGIKYNQTIRIAGANGREVDVVFAWMKSVEDDVIRLVTAIPTKK